MFVTVVACRGACGRSAREAAELALAGSSLDLRQRPESAPQHSGDGRPLLLIALDGVGRDMLYELVRTNRMPHLARLLGRSDSGEFPHAHFEQRFVATLPSSTIAAWTTALTGQIPAVHGVTGNEFFIRERALFAAPAPVSFDNPGLAMANYTDHYLDGFVSARTVYEQLRDREPHILIWVAMLQLQRGADTLILTSRVAYADAFRAFLSEQFDEEGDEHPGEREGRERPDVHRLFATLDQEVVDETVETLRERAIAPDVLCVYLPGPDLWAHVAPAGPDDARLVYLPQVIDPAIGRLAQALDDKGALADRFVVVTSDHGHTAVEHDDAHALGVKGSGEPPELLRKAGFRVRPFQATVAQDASYDSVLAYQGALAYVYLADRSACTRDRGCDWQRPPRFSQDVLVAAEAFHRNNRDGHLVPAMRGTLDLILTRRPVAFAEVDEPFQVYVGDGRLRPIESYLAQNPRPEYVELAARLRDLAVGSRGERAGDLLLLAHNGDRDHSVERYYFAARNFSWHGSPSHGDSALPLVVAHPRYTAQELAALTRDVLTPVRMQQALTPLLLNLRATGPAGAGPAD